MISDAETIQSALAFIPANNRELWLRMGMAVKSARGEDGFSIWDDWSRNAENYSDRDAKAVWQSIKPTGKVTVGTLIYEAQERGWKRSEPANRPNSAEIERQRRESADRAAKASAELAQRNAKARHDAQGIWEESESLKTHDYATAKGITAYGAKLYKGTLGISGKPVDGSIVTPLVDPTETIHGMQFITPTGDKLFLPGSAKSGHYFAIGKSEKRIVICEGYATACSIHEATGDAVVVAFDAGNLSPVTAAIRATYPNLDLVIAADNDEWKDDNVGTRTATVAAQAFNARLAVPKFKDVSGEPTDFNDLHKMEGLEAVKIQIEGAAQIEQEIKAEARLAELAVLATCDSEIEEPIPLQRPMPEATEYPVHALGTILGNAALKMAEAIQAPMAICGNSVLAAATLATQAQADVVIDGRRFPLSEIFISIGQSGERKSAVDKVALWPHREYENELRQAYEEQFSDYRRAKDAYDKTHDEAIAQSKSKTYQEKKKALDALKDVEPHKPLEPFLICEEPTYEGLVKMLAHGQPSIGLFSDEGGRFIGGHGMNSDNLLKTAAGMSGLWDGKAISRVRAGDGAALLPGRRVSSHLMAQPEVSRLLLSNDVLMEQGLLSRCLVTSPTSTAGTRLYREIDLSYAAELKAYNGRTLHLLRQPLPLRQSAQNELHPRELTLTQDAKRAWVQFHDAVELNLKDGGELAAIRGLANKAPEHAARLAGVLAVFNDPECQSISRQYMRNGILLVTHYIQEAQRLFGAGIADAKMVEAEKLLAWLRDRKDANGNPDRYVSLVEIYQRGPNGIRTAKAARGAMETLNAHYYVTPHLDGVEYDGKTRRDAWKLRG